MSSDFPPRRSALEPRRLGRACVAGTGLLALGLSILAAGGSAVGPEEGAKRAGEESSVGVDDPVFDWGKAWQGEVLRHTFTVENTGRIPLEIQDVKSHCGCTVPVLDATKRRLLAGEKTTVTLVTDTSTLRGAVKKDADIISNARAGDPKLWMQGEVVELLQFDPSLPAVEVVKDGLDPPLPTVVSVRPSISRDVKVLSVKPVEGILEATLEEVEPGKAYRIRLEPVKALKPEAFQTEFLELRTELDGAPLTLRSKISVVLKDRIEVSPSKSIYVPRGETESAQKAPVTKTLEVRSIGGAAHRFRIEKAIAKNGVFEVTCETVEAGRLYRLIAKLVKRPERGERFLKDTIEVATDDPSVPLITIPATAQF